MNNNVIVFKISEENVVETKYPEGYGVTQYGPFPSHQKAKEFTEKLIVRLVDIDKRNFQKRYYHIK